MSNTKFVFDKASGTLQPQKDNNATKTKDVIQKPTQPQTDTEKSDEEGIYKFRAIADLTSFQVRDEQTRRVMMVISGYGLSIKFNMEELRSTDKVEQLLNGLKDMFRKMIIEQSLSGGTEK